MTIWLITLLDGLHNMFLLLSFMFGAFIIASGLDDYIIEDYFSSEESHKKWIKRSFSIIFICLLLSWLIPDTKQAAAIYVLSSDTAQEIPQLVIDYLKQDIIQKED